MSNVHVPLLSTILNFNIARVLVRKNFDIALYICKRDIDIHIFRQIVARFIGFISSKLCCKD